MNSAVSPSASVLTGVSKARGLLNFIKREFICLAKAIFVPLYYSLLRTSLESATLANCPYLKCDILHIERIQRAAASLVEGLYDLTYEKELKVLKVPSLEKRRPRNELVLAHKVLWSKVGLAVTGRFKFSTPRSLHQTLRS